MTPKETHDFLPLYIVRSIYDGNGFARRKSDRLGLEGMRERALLAGGHLSIWSAEGVGTRVELTI